MCATLNQPIEVEKISFKHSPCLKKSIDITCIEYGLVDFESTDDEQTNTNFNNMLDIYIIFI